MTGGLNEVMGRECLVRSRFLADVCWWVPAWAQKAVGLGITRSYSRRRWEKRHHVRALPCRGCRGLSAILGTVFQEMGCQLSLQTGHHLWPLHLQSEQR